MKTSPYGYFDNREFSWLKWDERVVAEADKTLNPDTPLMERIRFLAIAGANLDDFFSVRVGALKEQLANGYKLSDPKTGLDIEEQLKGIIDRVRETISYKNKIFKTVCSDFEKAGIFKYLPFCTSEDECSENEKLNLFMKSLFIEKVLPFLTISKADTLAKSLKNIKNEQEDDVPDGFFFKNSAYFFAVEVSEKTPLSTAWSAKYDAESEIYIITISSKADRFLVFDVDGLAMPLVASIEHFICLYTPVIFQNLIKNNEFDEKQILRKVFFRVTRNAVLNFGEYLYDFGAGAATASSRHKLVAALEKMLSKRKRNAPIRVQYAGNMDLLRKIFPRLESDYFFTSQTPFDLRPFEKCISKELFKHSSEIFDYLFYPKFIQSETKFIDKSPIGSLQISPVLLSYPYQSTQPFLDLMEEASSSAAVSGIFITFYRIDKNGRLPQILINAARNGKEVNVVFELRARFDEENNVEVSAEFLENGINVVGGPDEYKVHAKVALLIIKDGIDLKNIGVISTGNFNETTAKQYSDYVLMTSDERITDELGLVFNSLLKHEIPPSDVFSELMVSPLSMRKKITGFFKTLAKSPTEKEKVIKIKINALTDRKLIDAIIKTAAKGVKFKILCRSASCLVIRDEGGKNIEIKSVVGRFLEHSRYYIFDDGTAEFPKVFISSADLMTRNQSQRVEVAAPVYDENHIKQILLDFDILWNDNNSKLWEQTPDGSYTKTSSDCSYDAQQEIYRVVAENS